MRQIEDEIQALSQESNFSLIEKPFKVLSSKDSQYLVYRNLSNFESLDDIQSRGKLDFKLSVQIMAKVAKTMDFLLKIGKGYHHGHLSPGNILVYFCHWLGFERLKKSGDFGCWIWVSQEVCFTSYRLQ